MTLKQRGTSVDLNLKPMLNLSLVNEASEFSILFMWLYSTRRSIHLSFMAQELLDAKTHLPPALLDGAVQHNVIGPLEK